MSLHTWHHHSPCNLSSCATFMLNPHWLAEVPQAKEKSCIYACGVTSVIYNSATLWTVACQFLCQGVLQARILECIGQYWLSYPSAAAAAAAKSLQSYPTLCDPIDGSPPVPAVPGILQARTLEWAAISFSNAWKWKVKSESEVAQSCPTLHNPMDCSPPGSSAHGIF